MDRMISIYTNQDKFEHAFFPQLQHSIAYATTRALKTAFRPAMRSFTLARFELGSATSTFSERSVFAASPTIPNRAFEFLRSFKKPYAEKLSLLCPSIIISNFFRLEVNWPLIR